MEGLTASSQSRRTRTDLPLGARATSGQPGRTPLRCSCNDSAVEVDADRVRELCSAVAADDPAGSEAAMRALCDEVRRNPLGHVETMVQAGRLADERGETLWEYEYLVQALREVDTSALHRLFDFVPTVPALWHAIDWAYHDHWHDIGEVVDYLGEPALCRAWHDYQRTNDERSWWTIDLVMHLADWTDGARRRRLLVRLADDADETTIVDVGCGPLKDFVSDDADDLDWLEAECARNSTLRRALRHVWCSTRVTLATLYRSTRSPESSWIDPLAGSRSSTPCELHGRACMPSRGPTSTASSTRHQNKPKRSRSIAGPFWRWSHISTDETNH